MGTRATYSFSFNEKTKGHVYIHWDGYPSGAATYFASAVARWTERPALSSERGGLLEAFLRANEQAELISDPQMHADTEFHYEVELSHSSETVHLRAYKYRWEKDEYESDREKVCFFSDSLSNFLTLTEAQQNDLAADL